MGLKHRSEKLQDSVEDAADGGFVSHAAHAVADAGSGLRDAAASGVHDVAHGASERVRAAAELGGHAAGGARDAVTGTGVALRTRRRKLVAVATAIAAAGIGLVARRLARRSKD